MSIQSSQEQDRSVVPRGGIFSGSNILNEDTTSWEVNQHTMLFFKTVMKCIAILSGKEIILAEVSFTPVALLISSHASINLNTQFAAGNNASLKCDMDQTGYDGKIKLLFLKTLAQLDD